MVIYFPQWQGSGFSNEIMQGALLIKKHLGIEIDCEIKMADQAVEINNEIIGYDAIYQQLSQFKKQIKVSKPDDIILFIKYLQSRFNIVGGSICESIATKKEQLAPIEDLLKTVKTAFFC